MDAATPFSIPANCPVCFRPVSVEGDFLYCRHKTCPARLSGSVKVWVDRLGLLFWGNALIDSLTSESSEVKSVADLYRLTVEDLARHCSGVKMARKCWKVLHDNVDLPLEVILSALNIQNLGLATATDVVHAGFDNIETILNMTYEDLIKVPNVGDVTARQILAGISERRIVLEDLQTVVRVKTPGGGGLLKGAKICITGDVWAPRKAVQKMIIEAGGQAVDTVSKDTKFLVSDDSDSTSSKSQKAKKYGIPIINGLMLKSMLEEKEAC